MLKELQELIEGWKQEAAGLAVIQYEKMSKIETVHISATIDWLRQCITDAELLLNSQPNSDTPPQLNKHEVSGRSEQSCGGDCGMNYCDEYGCIEAKPENAEPCPPQDCH